jgi:hypothetical protein
LILDVEWEADVGHGDLGTEIGVDLGALNAFGVTVGHYAKNVVGTAAERLALVFADGAQFGAATPSPDIQNARQTYAACLDAINTQMYALVDAATALAVAAQTMAADYAQTDAAVTAAVDAATRSHTVPPPRQSRLEFAE